MKKYKKTGRGLLGLIDRIKKPIGGVLAVAFIITAYSMASADDYQEVKRRAEPAAVPKAEEVVQPQKTEEPKRTYYDVPLTEDLQDIIIDTASRRGVDPALVLAVIEKESGYNPDASGDNGKSQGLMQIWRNAHKKRMKKLGAVNLYDPRDNVLVGIDILAEKLETIITRTTTNTRMRDFYDIYILDQLHGNTLNRQTLHDALRATAHKRGTEQHLAEAAEVFEEVENSPVMQKLWESYRRKFSYAADLEWNIIMGAVRSLYALSEKESSL